MGTMFLVCLFLTVVSTSILAGNFVMGVYSEARTIIESRYGRI